MKRISQQTTTTTTVPTIQQVTYNNNNNNERDDDKKLCLEFPEQCNSSSQNVLFCVCGSVINFIIMQKCNEITF